MRPFNSILALLLAFILLLSVAGCKKDPPGGTGNPITEGSEGSKLPVVTIDGNEYPITVENGILGLEQIHNGVISQQFAGVEPGGDGNFSMAARTHIYRENGTKFANYGGEKKIWLQSAWTTDFAGPKRRGYLCFWELIVGCNGFPFAGGKAKNANQYLDLLAQDGFSRISEDSSNLDIGPVTYVRFYTENGPIDVSAEDTDFLQQENLRQLVYFYSHYPIEQTTINENGIRKNSDLWSCRWAAYQMIRMLQEEKAKIGCVLYVKYTPVTGELQSLIRLITDRSIIEDWYRGWSSFGVEIEPGGFFGSSLLDF